MNQGSVLLKIYQHDLFLKTVCLEDPSYAKIRCPQIQEFANPGSYSQD